MYVCMCVYVLCMSTYLPTYLSTYLPTYMNHRSSSEANRPSAGPAIPAFYATRRFITV